MDAGDRVQATWTCGKYIFDLSVPLVMGIVNATPDSFSGDGIVDDPQTAISRGIAQFEEGARLIDVGGESTRPGSVRVSDEEEIRRVLPIVSQLCDRGIPVSIDTRSAEVARICVEAGACVINDITGFASLDMIETAQSCSAGLIVMHMQGEPGTMQDSPQYDDLIGEVATFLSQTGSMLEERGITSSRIAIDPGFGFGKTVQHNVEILQETSRLSSLGYPLVVAVSRKQTIGVLAGEETPEHRVSGSIAAALFAVSRGARIVRTHDVRETVDALRVYEALCKQD